ncbi:MAG: SigE family RNA polymerase sigma factor [Dactylosporangium sp.]|nr:SigE family RNA polymerase sigma factor [Dactylosporangium sp.]NNJ59494.1 SigE family RNA polymerase sigma factor [Dactylosporangium sp.]
MSDDFDSFVVARGRALLRFAYVLSGNGHLAEDIVQEVLARAHQKWSRIESMEAPEAYIRRAIVREYLSWRRRRASTEEVMADVPDRADPSDPAHTFVERGQMWELLSELPRSQRAVLVLRFYGDLADEDIANTLGCSQSTVRAHASRALARLRSVLGGRHAMEVDRG